MDGWSVSIHTRSIWMQNTSGHGIVVFIPYVSEPWQINNIFMKKKSLVRQGYSAIRRGAAVCGGKDPEDVLQIRPAGNSPSGLSVAAAFCKGKNSQELNFPQV